MRASERRLEASKQCVPFVCGTRLLDENIWDTWSFQVAYATQSRALVTMSESRILKSSDSHKDTRHYAVDQDAARTSARGYRNTDLVDKSDES